jgi:rare lipoprotein A
MLFNKTISTLIACGAVGAAVMSPTHTQAISAITDAQNEPIKSEWVEKFQQKIPTYMVPLASVYRGQASWYGPGFYGNRTANGEIYRPGTMTAAHRYLPFGTQVRVTNLRNGRTAIVRINDRGPYSGGRIIDLGEGAASYLGVRSTGLAPVRLEVLK